LQLAALTVASARGSFFWTGAIVAMLTIVSGCAGPAAVDGWPIGALADCRGARAADCRALIDAASGALSQREPGHPPIVSIELHEEGRRSTPLVIPS
jgi:hypothetical protein